MIPEGWHQQLLGDVCEIKIGGTPARKESEYWAKDKSLGYPWVSIADLKSKWITNTKESISELGVKKSNVKLINTGTTIMSFKLTIGRVARAGIDLYTNEAIAALVPLNGQIDNDFLYYALPTAVGKTETDQAVKGATLNKKKLNDVIFLIPPLQEQKKIAAILGSVDDAIQATQAVIDQTRRVKQGLMQQLLTRGIGHTRFKQTEIGEIPEGWHQQLLGDVCEIKIGGTPARKESEYWAKNKSLGYPWVSIADLKSKWITNTKESISELGVKKSNVKLINAGTTIMSFKLTIGRVARAGINLYTNEAIAALEPLNGQVDNDFLYYALPTAVGKTETDQAVKGATLNKKKLNDVIILIPPLQEQKKIATILNSIYETLQAEQAKLQQTINVKNGLMQDLLTGRVRVKLDGVATT